MISEMIAFNESEGWIITDVQVLQGELAYIDKISRRLFIPMVRIEMHLDGFYRCILANEMFWEDTRIIKQKMIRAVPTWDLIFSHKPVTMEFLGWWDSEDARHYKDMRK